LVEKLQAIGFDFYITYDDIAYKSEPMFFPQVLHKLFFPRLKRPADTFTIPWVYKRLGSANSITNRINTPPVL